MDTNPRRTRQLEYISQFITDIRYVPGEENGPADTLSRLNALTREQGLDYNQLAQEQATDTLLHQLLSNPATTGLKLQQVTLPGTTIQIYCDISWGQDQARPYLTPSFRAAAFNTVHNLAHVSPRTTAKLLADRFVWPSIQQDARRMARACLACQKAKVTRHTRTPVGDFQPTMWFEHMHIDIVGPLPPSRGNSYIVTMIDQTTSWPEAVPTSSITAENVARIFLSTWVARFGAPACITTDQGRQFESQLLVELTRLFGIQRIRTTAYNPKANGKVERWHRVMKAAIMAYASPAWAEYLPVVLLGLRAAVCSDNSVSPVQLTYNTTLRLPSDMVVAPTGPPTTVSDFVRDLAKQFCSFATHVRRHGATPVFVPSTLARCTHVFERIDTPRGALEPPYQGPYAVIERDDKTIVIAREDGSHIRLSLDRVKPAWLLTEPMAVEPVPVAHTTQPQAKRVTFPHRPT